MRARSGDAERRGGYPFPGMAVATRSIARELHRRQARRRGRWRARRPPPRTRRWRRSRGCSTNEVEAVLEANAADLADERAAELTEALRDRLTLTGAGRGDGRGLAAGCGARIRSATCSTGHDPRTGCSFAGAGADRRGRHHLRGAARTSPPTRRALPEERQRGRPARVERRARRNAALVRVFREAPEAGLPADCVQLVPA